MRLELVKLQMHNLKRRPWSSITFMIPCCRKPKLWRNWVRNWWAKYQHYWSWNRILNGHWCWGRCGWGKKSTNRIIACLESSVNWYNTNHELANQSKDGVDVSLSCVRKTLIKNDLLSHRPNYWLLLHLLNLHTYACIYVFLTHHST